MRLHTISATVLAGLVLVAVPTLAGDLTVAKQGVEPRPGERYFAVFLAQQSADNEIKLSHTFATFVRTTAGERQARVITEQQTISWFPKSGIVSIARAAEPGVNKSLAQSLAWAEERDLEVTLLGPYEINAELYDRVVKQVERLNNGELKYRCFDTMSRATAKNCIHALSDIDVDNGRLNTGSTRGRDATQMVVEHLKRFFVSQGVVPEADSLLDALGLTRFKQPALEAVAGSAK
jgi:hypothetical protein